MRQSGFTLVELMIVVAILGVLAVVAGAGYRKYMSSARKAEVMAMIGEFKAKQEAYRAEFNTYCGSNATDLANGSDCLTATNETTLYPALLASGEPTPKSVATLAARPGGWQRLGINPQRNQLYCGYVAVAGPAGTAPTGADGQALYSTFPGNAPTTPWFYIRAQCDNDGNAAVNVTYTTAHNTTTVVTRNENK
jgi:type IV pilus assembly protein PilE